MRPNMPIMFIVLLLGGGFVVFGIITGDIPRIVRDYFSASLAIQDNGQTANEGNGAEKIYDLKYSFSEDDDGDGLSNAKEIIYGADPQNKDTDGDGHPDGEEVKKGYDPTRAGDATLEARFSENNTIHFFSWAQKKTAHDDPRLDTRLVNEFIATQLDLSPPLSEVTDADLTKGTEDTYEAVLAYFRELESVPLPTVASSYFDISQEAALGNLENVEKAVNQLTVINGQLRATPTPPVALTLQKKYIQLVTSLKILFADLYLARVDPIKLAANLERGKALIKLIQEIAIETANIVNRYQIPETP